VEPANNISSKAMAGREKFALSSEFTENILRLCGERGRAWLNELPEIVSTLEREWGIIVDPPFVDLSYNYVAPATDSSRIPVVIKIGLPIDDGEIYSEADYLRFKNGQGAVKLLAENKKLRALLLERALPGKSLKTVFFDNRKGALDVSMDVLRRLVAGPRPASEYILLEKWTGKLEQIDSYPEFPREYALRALAIFAGSSPADRVLLHGDLHHTNILSSGDTFIAIDPKGIIGDVKYDIGVLLNNHYGWIKHFADVKQQMQRAVEKFAFYFDQSPESIREWAFAQKVLAAYWTMTENNPRWRRQLAVADIWNV
jgi:streptomycin 6-kinase